MFRNLATLAVLAAWALTTVSADITILAPSSSYWWIANSQNLYSWTCGSNYNEGYTNFTVLINNSNPTLFSGPLALVAVQWDYDCSVLLPPVPSLPAGPGYTLYFGDVFNQTHVIASSSVFEIKPVGSAYAPQPSGVSSASATAATGSASPSGTAKKSSALGSLRGNSAISLIGAASVAFVGFMAL